MVESESDGNSKVSDIICRLESARDVFSVFVMYFLLSVFWRSIEQSGSWTSAAIHLLLASEDDRRDARLTFTTSKETGNRLGFSSPKAETGHQNSLFR